MYVRIISIGVETSVENQGSVHERARVDKTATLTNLHFFNIKDEATIENLESHSAFASKYHNFVVGDLICKTHVRRNPLRLIYNRSWNLLPNISRNVVAFDSVDNLLLINTTAKGENIVVFECTETHTSSRNSHRINLFPLVLLSIILLAIAIDRIIDVSAYNINKSI
jgi:hypothetical protein